SYTSTLLRVSFVNKINLPFASSTISWQSLTGFLPASNSPQPSTTLYRWLLCPKIISLLAAELLLIQKSGISALAATTAPVFFKKVLLVLFITFDLYEGNHFKQIIPIPVYEFHQVSYRMALPQLSRELLVLCPERGK